MTSATTGAAAKTGTSTLYTYFAQKKWNFFKILSTILDPPFFNLQI